MLKVSVTNFGPIKEGTVRLRPLTVFVGPNNSGKSYFAMLVYALLRSFAHPGGGGWRGWQVFPSFHPEPVWQHLDRVQRQLAKRLVQKVRKGEIVAEKNTLRLSSVDAEMQALLDQYFSYVMEVVAEGFSLELKRCYGATISELTKAVPGGNLAITAEQDNPQAIVDFLFPEGTAQIRKRQATFSAPLSIPIPRSFLRLIARKESIFLPVFPFFLHPSLGSFLTEAHYLPAARSGILHGQKALSGLIVSRSPLAGLEPLEVPQLSGVVVDLLSSLLFGERKRPVPKELRHVLELLEKGIAGGTIDTRAEPHQAPEIIYDAAAGGKLPLHRASSMVSEIAPIILFLKYVIRPGQLLIIEEPEAHLHPENQRKMASVLAALVEAGVKVLITTHSDYLVQELSNTVASSKGSASEDKKKLSPENVGVYLFRYDDPTTGTVVEEITVDDEGIKEEEFARVARELYEETVSLRMKALSGRHNR